jgi:hypothetical protein
MWVFLMSGIGSLKKFLLSVRYDRSVDNVDRIMELAVEGQFEVVILSH